MAVDMQLSPKTKRPNGDPCCEPVVYPDVEREEALRMAEVAKALGDPIRLQLIDVLRKHAARSASASSCRCSTSPSRRCHTT
jgi:ArsR family transcriptional regulator